MCEKTSTCPLAVAVRKINGGFVVGDAPRAKIGGANIVATESNFRAVAAKIELARDIMKSRKYSGDLLTLRGQDRICGVCYLLNIRGSPICNLMNTVCSELNHPINAIGIEMCVMYPNCLYETINEIIAEKCPTVTPLPKPNIDMNIITGVFNAGDSYEDLDTIADDLLMLSKFCGDIEAYHMRAAEKISMCLEYMGNKHDKHEHTLHG